LGTAVSCASTFVAAGFTGSVAARYARRRLPARSPRSSPASRAYRTIAIRASLRRLLGGCSLRECDQLVLHFKPTSRQLAGADYRKRFVTYASHAAHLRTCFRGSAELFDGGTHLLRRGVECLDLCALLRWQVGVRWIEIGQADYSEACQPTNDSTYPPGFCRTSPALRRTTGLGYRVFPDDGNCATR
jgi:hypothetical protein